MEHIRKFYADAVNAAGGIGRLENCKDVRILLRADHIGFKCASTESFERRKAFFEFNSRWMYQSIISGRRIAIVGLAQCIETYLGPVNILELSDVKLKNPTREGFDHLEAYPVSFSYGSTILELQNSGMEIKRVVRPHHTTHDINIDGSFILRLTEEPLLQKIKRTEMA